MFTVNVIKCKPTSKFVGSLLKQLNDVSNTLCNGITRPEPTSSCALPSNFQALPSPAQLIKSYDSTMDRKQCVTCIEMVTSHFLHVAFN